MEPGAANYDPGHTENEFCDWIEINTGIPLAVELRCDANLDGSVNTADLSNILSKYSNAYPWFTILDVNNSGVVNTGDLTVLLASFGLTGLVNPNPQ
jgi:hypothetical protein